MREILNLTKALADGNRLRALSALRGRELCLCQIAELLGLAWSTTSKHMSVLHRARLVEGRKQGRWMYYRLARKDAPPAVRRALAWVLDALARSEQVRQDRRRLREILRLDPEELCRRRSAR